MQILPAGASPHTFDLTPGQVRELQKARIIFKIGLIDDWIDGIGESAPGAAIVSLHKRIVLKPFHDDDHHHAGTGTSHSLEFDPHYWLDARNGVLMTQDICDRLSALDPAHAGIVR